MTRAVFEYTKSVVRELLTKYALIVRVPTRLRVNCLNLFPNKAIRVFGLLPTVVLELP